MYSKSSHYTKFKTIGKSYMYLSLSYLIAVFLEVSKASESNNIKVVSNEDNFICFINNLYFEKGNLFKISFNTNLNEYKTTTLIKLLDNIEGKILYASTEVSFKVISLVYKYASTKGIDTYALDIKIEDVALLYKLLSITYLLIKGYNISETEDVIIIKTPTNNTRTIKWNDGWYCDCKSYADHARCIHAESIDIYLKHRNQYNLKICN